MYVYISLFMQEVKSQPYRARKQLYVNFCQFALMMHIWEHFSVYTGVCQQCGVACYVDGHGHGILNMGNYLLSHDLLENYCKLYVTEG